MEPADGPPVRPLNFASDLVRGMLLAIGVLAALVERGRSYLRQVLDVAMAAGAAFMTSRFFALHVEGRWSGDRGCNLVDGRAPFYRCWWDAASKYMPAGVIEADFFTALLKKLETDAPDLLAQTGAFSCLRLSDIFARAVALKPHGARPNIFDETDTCARPVLGLVEAFLHRHNSAQAAFEFRRVDTSRARAAL